MVGSIDIIGGGPGGLYLAILLSGLRPAPEVRVFERELPEETFGFGVGFSGRMLTRLSEQTPEILSGLVSLSASIPGAEFRLPRGSRYIPGSDGVAIERSMLLKLLTDSATGRGVEIRHGALASVDQLQGELQVAADGASSATRRASEAEFGAEETTARGRFLWCGCEIELNRAIYAVAESEAGPFVVHAYPYRTDRATVLVECDEATWRASGMAANDSATVQGETDSRSLATLSELFADLLEGRELIGNRTTWRRFPTVSCQRWSVGPTVLLGDAAHTAHYTVGSGTKLAMEDAIALARAIELEATVAEVGRSYEDHRKPVVEDFQEIAARSQRWWEGFPSRRGDGPASVAFSFLTRTGSIPVDRILESDFDLVESAAAETGIDGGVLATDGVAALALQAPLALADGVTLPGRLVGPSPWGVDPIDLTSGSVAPTTVSIPADLSDPWGEEADEIVAGLAAQADRPHRVVWLCPTGGEPASLEVLELCERVRRELGFAVVADFDPAEPEQAATAILAGRVDLVRVAAGADDEGRRTSVGVAR